MVGINTHLTNKIVFEALNQQKNKKSEQSLIISKVK